MSFKEPTPYAALQAENKELKAKNEKLKVQTVFLQDHNNTLQTRCRHRNEELAKRKRQLFEKTEEVKVLQAKCARHETMQAIHEKALDDAAGAVLESEDNVQEIQEECLAQATIIEALKVENQKQAKIIELLQGPEDPLRAENAALRAENERLKAVCDRGEALVALRNQELEQERETLQQARNTIRDLAVEARGQAMMVQALEHDNEELKKMLKAKDAFTEDLQGQVKKTAARRIDTLMVEPSVLHTMTVEDKVSDDEELVRAMTISDEEQFNNDLAMAMAESLKLAGEQPEPSGKIDTGLLTTFYQNTKP